MSAVYLDNNATTCVHADVVAAMLPFFTESYGNASSSHAFGEAVAMAVRDARRSLQSLLGAAHDHEIVFTSGGTEADNSAVLSALEAQPDKRHIVTTRVEHPAMLSLLAHLEKTQGVSVTSLEVDGEGRLDIAAFEAALTPETALASVMWANNETGAIFPVAELSRIARAKGVLFHTDAVQAVGKIAIDLAATEIDMLSLSGHKLHAPKGIGALYIRKGTPFCPLIRGGRQERGRRAGTENVPAIVGLGCAAEIAARRLRDERDRLTARRDRLERGLLQRVEGARVLSAGAERVPNTADVTFEGLNSDAILNRLERAGIAASSGSACASGSMEPSHVLRAMNVPPTELWGAIRFSLSYETSDEEVERTLAVLSGLITELQEKSPFWADRRATQAGGAVTGACP